MTLELDFNIALNEENNFQLMPVKGEYVEIPGFETFKFFVHKTDDFYNINEFTTGANIAHKKYLMDALENAKINLNSVGIEQFKDMITMTLNCFKEPVNKTTAE